MKFKKFLNRIMLLTITVFLGFIFWIGIESKNLPENSIGIRYTKTTGWHNKPLESGNFSWSYEKVIPNNYNLHVFNIKPIDISFNTEKSLPSSELYANYNNIDVDNFNYSYRVTSNYKIKNESVLTLVSQGVFTESNFKEWETNNVEKIKNIIDIYISNRILTEDTDNIASDLKEYLSSEYIYYNINEFNLYLTKPDLELYNTLKSRYLEELTIKESASKEYLVESLKQKNKEQLKLDSVNTPWETKVRTLSFFIL